MAAPRPRREEEDLLDAATGRCKTHGTQRKIKQAVNFQKKTRNDCGMGNGVGGSRGSGSPQSGYEGQSICALTTPIRLSSQGQGSGV